MLQHNAVAGVAAAAADEDSEAGPFLLPSCFSPTLLPEPDSS